MRRYGLIDALRGVSALLVLLSHVGFWTGADGLDVSGGLLARGDSGVAVFFAISAFLLLGPWLAGDRRSLAQYAKRRAARILPAYVVALAAVLLVAATWGAVGGGGLGGLGKVFAHVLLVQGYADTSYQSFSQTWSLTTEVTFYLLVPAIGTALRRALEQSREQTYAVLAAVALAGIATQAVTALWTQLNPTSHAGVLGTSVLGHAAWFAVGAALAVAVRTGDIERLRTVGVGTWLAAAGVVYLLASSGIAGPRDLHAPTIGQAIAKETLYTALAALLLIAAVRRPSDERWIAVAASPATRFAGEVSYGVFLWHVLVLQLIYLTSGWQLFTGRFSAVLFAVLVFSVLIAWASATLVEQPVLRWAHRRRTSTPRVPVPRG